MKIYTKTGDEGSTSLFGGNRVMKSDNRVESYGTVDELNSFVGLMILHISSNEIKDDLSTIQHILFNLGSILATVEPMYISKLPQIEEKFNQVLEHKIDKMNEELPEMKQFVLPGGSLAGAHAHICRTICRRAERAVVKEYESSQQKELLACIKFLNRLSDYFFVLARFLTQLNKSNEVIWKQEINFL